MTIFDVIRYPVNTNFTVDDLIQLPADLLYKWYVIDFLGVPEPLVPLEVRHMANVIHNHFKGVSFDPKYDSWKQDKLDKLRKRIAEYDSL